MNHDNDKPISKWCPVCVIYWSCVKDGEKCGKCGNELLDGEIPDYMVSSIL